MKNKYYSLIQSGREATINIYGDITSWEWLESDVSSYTLSKELEGLDVDRINVHINSYGGEVAEGVAIYNTLKDKKAKVVTYCDGFACSIASVIFMAGDERVMADASLLMIHNAWTRCRGNANEMRKAADDLDIINDLAVKAYMSSINITQEELKQLMDNESFISSDDAFAKGFATSISKEESEGYSQSAKKQIAQMLMKQPAEPVVDYEQLSKALLKNGGEISEARKVIQELLSKMKSLEPEPETEPSQLWNGFFNAILKEE